MILKDWPYKEDYVESIIHNELIQKKPELFTFFAMYKPTIIRDI